MSSHVFHRSADRPRIAAGASGIWITDDRGKRYIDGSGGAAVSCLGHGDPRVVEAIRAQAATLDYAHTGAFTSAPAEELAELICTAPHIPFARAFIVSSGSEAVETALKMARGYHLARGEPARHRVIARRQSYHGATLGGLSRGGHMARRAPYLPMLGEAHLIEPCYAYRNQRPDETPEAYGMRAADALEAEILRLGPGSVSAFLAETVVGATTGAVAAAPGYLARCREICDRHGVLMILDEVMCGTHRCGPFLACAEDGVAPDIVTLGKGLGGGYQPIAAALCSARVHAAFADSGTAFVHGHTYMAHPVACAAALAVQRVIVEDGLAANVVRMGERLAALLVARFGNHPNVGDIRGRGLLQAIELVDDRGTRAPFAPGRAVAAKIAEAAVERGLLTYPGNGTSDGETGDHVLLAPPYTVTEDLLVEIVDRLGAAVEAVLGR